MGLVAFLQGTPVIPAASAWLVPQALSKKRGGQVLRGVRAGGGMWGRGGPAGWEPWAEVSAAREGREAGAGIGVSRVRDAGPGDTCWPSVRRVSLPSGTGLPARCMAQGSAGGCWGLAARLRRELCGGRGGSEECLWV